MKTLQLCVGTLCMLFGIAGSYYAFSSLKVGAGDSVNWVAYNAGSATGVWICWLPLRWVLRAFLGKKWESSSGRKWVTGTAFLAIWALLGYSLIWTGVEDYGLVSRFHVFMLTIAPFIAGTWLVGDGLMSWIREPE